MAEDKDMLERIVVLEQSMKGLIDTVNKYIAKADASDEKLIEKLDAFILAVNDRPTFAHCVDNRKDCNDRFTRIEKDTISKTSATIFGVLIAIISILGTLLSISNKAQSTAITLSSLFC